MLPPGEKPLSDPNAGGPIVMPEDRPAAAAPPRGKRPLLVRLLPLLIVVVALGGFGGIVGYYYLANSAGGVDGVAPLVRADQRPVRVRPENPGGMDVPHQDKEIYDKVAGRGAAAPAAERLLPPPETPMPRPAAPPQAATPAVPGSGSPVGSPGTLAAAPPRPPTAPPPQEVRVPPPPDVRPPADVTSQRTIPPPPPGSTVLPGASRPAASAPTAAPAPSPAIAVAPRAAPSGGSRVVLASVQSEADARREWERLRRQYGDALNGMTPDFVRTDLGERGVYWRIYVGPVESGPEAQARCTSLKQRQVNCFVARP
jgi:hypothetical protein